ncbi:outer membrane beta-barrel protein [Daejeonella lutea]|uniref:Outer membrane receptor proteins, mostly Fe transport n=1 Tax=Daejeonella lutea TaxID=572036 RepID=A0A1T5AYW0_9SPHI|nr:outer membrane beta-barrel protein [Daejeonella lutea]SKB40009.1 Outer membrane receptor proteins, mostly Fe transport [Daejeonella lutea]
MKNIVLPFLLLLFSVSVSFGQSSLVTISGQVKDAKDKSSLPYVNLLLKNPGDSSLAQGTISNEDGRFTFSGIKPGRYLLEVSYIGYRLYRTEQLVGSLSPFLDLGTIELQQDTRVLGEVVVTASVEDGVSDKMDKKVFTLENNVSQSGGSVLQAMQNLPGVTLQDGKVQLRGNDKVAVLIDGKQNAITGFGSQTGLDNIPASAIERIEIINNPSAKFDANGNAGIINIIYKKNRQEGWNGKLGLTSGLGALWVRQENLPGIRPQFQSTPKLNPSLSLNYRKNKLNTFMQADWLYTQTLNRNEFGERRYSSGELIRQQVKRNRTTTFSTIKTGVDWNPDEHNSFTLSGFFNREKIIDKGDTPYFNGDLSQRMRLWQFLEDEVKYTATGSALFQHKFTQPGHLLNAGFNYTFHREDEKYFFTNIMPSFTGNDSFKLLSDEHVADLNLDYIKPMKHGRFETGLKFRRRTIPTNMQFFRGLNSPLDANAGGWADYKETIPALYGNYIFESRKVEIEAGIRLEYVKVDYDVNPNHNTYKSDGYDYAQPFPNLRFGYKLSDNNKLSVFYNRRVDRPNEVDIRIFPKYDEPEVLKVGNPTLRPQFTDRFELGNKRSWSGGSLYTALYHTATEATITRIGTIVPGNTIIYNIFQNAGSSANTGGELSLQQQLNSWWNFNTSAALYRNKIDAFTIENRYPVPTTYTMAEQQITSGNIKLNNMFKLPGQADLQIAMVYLAPDIIPQGRIESRFSVDAGIKKQIQQGKGELFANGSDLFNTLRIKRKIVGNGFNFNSTDYYETQVIRLGYSYKF